MDFEKKLADILAAVLNKWVNSEFKRLTRSW